MSKSKSEAWAWAHFTKKMEQLTLVPYHKRRCKCPFCGMQVVAHKLMRHQRRALCQLSRKAAKESTRLKAGAGT